MTTSFKAIVWWLTILSGLTLIFIGIRFFILPEVAETGFGITVNTGGDFSFHYIKAVRDLFAGLLVIALLLLKERRALGISLLLSGIIPTVDLWVVMSHPHYDTARIYPHLIAMFLCFGLGLAFLRQGK